MVKTKEERNKYINEWKKQNKDRLYIIVPKGKKDTWKEHAQQNNLSLSQLISIAVDNYIEQSEQEHNKNVVQEIVDNIAKADNKSFNHKGITFNR